MPAESGNGLRFSFRRGAREIYAVCMKLGFIGAGKMATAIARGAVAAGLCAPEDLIGSARTAATRERFAAETGGMTVDDNAAVVSFAEVVVLGVKPADACITLASLRPEDRLVVSIAAGVKLTALEAAAPGAPLVRVMPNTPCLVQKGASAFAMGAFASPEHGRLVFRLFSAIGDAHEVPEYQIDAVTGLSGSGPAYVYLVIEALADGGVLMGLPRTLAASLAAQTVLGAAEMVRQTGRHPAELREAVASPGGTTIAALEALEEHGARAAFIAAVRASAERAMEMGR